MDDAVKTMVESVLGQGEFLASLATAMLGGCFGLLGWQVTKKVESSVSPFRWILLVLATIILMSVSLAAFYLGYGNLISSMPDLAFVEKSTGISSDQMRQRLLDAGLGSAQPLFGLQAISLLLSVPLIIVFAIRNYWIVK